MITKITFEIGDIFVYETYVIAVMFEGVNVTPEYNVVLENIAEKYFKNRPFGYISYRKNSYAVDPMIYRQTSEIENLVGFAVVSNENDELKLTNVQIEKLFLKKPFKHFFNLEEAKIWINETVKENSTYS